MRKFVVLAALSVAGCIGPQSALEPPVVDMRGLDTQKHAADLAECTERGRAFITVGAPITSCMREKGYTIVVPKG